MDQRKNIVGESVAAVVGGRRGADVVVVVADVVVVVVVRFGGDCGKDAVGVATAVADAVLAVAVVVVEFACGEAQIP